MPRREIRLKVVGFGFGGHVHLICLDTYQIVRATNIHEAKMKMVDALTGYLRTFSTEELMAGEYLRPAPLRYRSMWVLLRIVGPVHKAWGEFLSSFTYDPQSERLSLA